MTRIWEQREKKIGKVRGRIESRLLKRAGTKKHTFVLVSIFLAIILFYTLYIGELLWGIVIDVLVLRLYFLMKRERRYLAECDQNEEEAGTPHDPRMKRKIWIVNMLITLFVLGLVIYSYFSFQFIWGVVAGLLILLCIHMLLFTKDNL